METGPDTDLDRADRPGIAQLVGQLAEDTRAFARAEIAFLKAQAGERVGHAAPGAGAIAFAAVLAFAAIVALVVGAMMALASLWGIGLAVLATTSGTILIAAILGKWGTARIKSALKSREER